MEENSDEKMEIIEDEEEEMICEMEEYIESRNPVILDMILDDRDFDGALKIILDDEDIGDIAKELGHKKVDEILKNIAENHDSEMADVDDANLRAIQSEMLGTSADYD